MSNKNKKKSISRAKKLELLNAKKIELQKKLDKQKKEKFKQLNIRNLKVFGKTCNFLVPFVLCGCITVGAFKIFGGGFPFVTDKIEKYKLYDLDFDSKGYVSMNEEYTNFGILSVLDKNELVVYSPWKKTDNGYSRTKREYKVKTIKSLELFDAVLNEDYSYIKDNITDFEEEVQTSNEIDEESNNYIIQASLRMLDKTDFITFDETELKNIIITIVEIVLGLGIPSIIAWRRDFEYLYEIKYINEDYQEKIKPYKSIKAELNETNNKILSLSKKKGGRK